MLEEYRWPGNVRELKNLMERAAILVERVEVAGEDLASWLDSGAAGLGIDRTNLHRKMRKYAIARR